MKKTAAMLISGVLMLSLCACGGTAEPDPVPTGTPAPITYTKDDGRLKMEETYNSNGLLFSTIIYEYDNKGRLVKQAEFGINDAPTGYKSFEYDKNGRKTLMTSFVLEDVVIAVATCDSADIMYENYKYGLPLNLASEDRLYWLSTGAYTTSYSAVEFNGFPPLKSYYL